MKKLYVLILSVSLLLSLVSCAKPLEDVVETKETEVKLEGGVDDFDTPNNDLKVDFDIVEISDVENEKMYQLVSYPVTSLSKETNLKDAINDMNKYYKEAAEKFKDDNKENVRDFLKQYGDDGDSHYTHEVYPYVFTNNDKYLSLFMRTEEDLLGAHGSYYLEGFNFDKKTGKKLSVYDIVKSKEALKEYVLKWCDEHKDDENLDLFDEYKDTVDAYFRGEYELQFIIDNDSISVIFQAYDLAPYSTGPIEIMLDETVLK